MSTTGFSATDMELFHDDAKVGLLATVSPEGLPHVSLITTLQARTSTQLTWGQFTEGRSKDHVRAEPRVGWLIMTPDRKLWRGRARWTGAETSGEEYEAYNRKPMFRYNSYFGIHTVHQMDLVSGGPREALPLAGIAAGTALVAAARRLVRGGDGARALRPWAQDLFSRVDTFKFLSWVDAEGYPTLVPLVPCAAAGGGRLVFAPTVYRRELASLDRGADVAVFCMNMDAESVLARGRFEGFGRRVGARTGTLGLDWVYNSMPPQPGQIYPAVPLEPVRSFEIAG
jgi:hypothetical protein